MAGYFLALSPEHFEDVALGGGDFLVVDFYAEDFSVLPVVVHDDVVVGGGGVRDGEGLVGNVAALPMV